MKTIRENSLFRIGWDLIILMLVIASCLLIPFQIAFQHVIGWRAAGIIYPVAYVSKILPDCWVVLMGDPGGGISSNFTAGSRSHRVFSMVTWTFRKSAL